MKLIVIHCGLAKIGPLLNGKWKKFVALENRKHSSSQSVSTPGVHQSGEEDLDVGLSVPLVNQVQGGSMGSRGSRGAINDINISAQLRHLKEKVSTTAYWVTLSENCLR